MKVAPEHLNGYFKAVFNEIIYKDDFEEGIYANLSGGYGGIDARNIILRIENAFGLAD